MSELQDILDRPGTVVLDDALDSQKSALLFQDPRRVIQCSVPDEVPDCLKQVDSEVAAGQYAAGFMAYEAGSVFGGKQLTDASKRNWETDLGYPVLWFGLYDDFSEISTAELDKLALLPVGQSAGPSGAPSLVPRIDKTSYSSGIAKIQSLIQEGDLYQLNYTFRMDGLWSRHPGELYALLRARQPVSYGAYLNLGDTQVLSASPEKFFSRNGDTITVRPMKGTAPRGETPELDHMYEQWLACDQKNRAENLMILDLFRNDLSRICEPASVGSDPVFTVERYDTLFQMVSGVKGDLKPNMTYAQIFEALFPSGSITGAPKIRAMQRISELEQSPRGVYCGAIGYIRPDRNASFSVAIRTSIINSHKLVTGSGGGIVWDSIPSDEFNEAVLKTRYLSSQFDKENSEGLKIVESVYIDVNKVINKVINKGINKSELIDAHITRLINSAKALGFSTNRRNIQAQIHSSISSLDRNVASSPYKMRVLLGVDGELAVSFSAVAQSDLAQPVRIGVSSVPVHSENPFLYHKTTFRPDYERGKREAIARQLDDVFFVNEDGFLTETTICNIFLRHGDVWRTPPVECGLLAGVKRASELESERRPLQQKLTLADLESADEIILTNAVRGRRRATYIV